MISASLLRQYRTVQAQFQPLLLDAMYWTVSGLQSWLLAIRGMLCLPSHKQRQRATKLNACEYFKLISKWPYHGEAVLGGDNLAGKAGLPRVKGVAAKQHRVHDHAAGPDVGFLHALQDTGLMKQNPDSNILKCHTSRAMIVHSAADTRGYAIAPPC